MIDIRPEDVVVERRTHDGRFVIFTNTDLPHRSPIPWWGVTFDTGEDGHGILVRLDETYGPAGWTAFDLLEVATSHMQAEQRRQPRAVTAEAWGHLCLAAAFDLERTGSSGACDVTYEVGADGPYPWTVAGLWGSMLPLCPDPAGRAPGVTVEAILVVLDQLFRDAAAWRPRDTRIRNARQHVGRALAAETQRVRLERG